MPPHIPLIARGIRKEQDYLKKKILIHNIPIIEEHTIKRYIFEVRSLNRRLNHLDIPVHLHVDRQTDRQAGRWTDGQRMNRLYRGIP